MNSENKEIWFRDNKKEGMVREMSLDKRSHPFPSVSCT